MYITLYDMKEFATTLYVCMMFRGGKVEEMMRASRSDREGKIFFVHCTDDVAPIDISC